MSKRAYHCLLLLFCIALPVRLLPQGLRFNGGEKPIDVRTSCNVFAKRPASFAGSFTIGFDLALYPEKPIGYILRVKNRKGDKIYNLFYDGQGDNILFLFNEEGKSSLIAAEIERGRLIERNWFPMSITFDLAADSIVVSIDGRRFGAGGVDLPDKYYPEIIFGKSDHIIDVPSFAVKELRVGNRRREHRFALRENRGGVVHDEKGRPAGTVANPVWLVNDSYNWRFRCAFQSVTVAGSNYNPARKEVYYFNRDSIYIYNVRTGAREARKFPEKCPVSLTLGTNFIDPADNRLYAYEVYESSSMPPGGPKLASLDLGSGRWRVESYHTLPTQLHHHGSCFDPATHRYTIFGGFGNMRYNKNFYTFETATGQWQVAEDFGGDAIFPRYFSSVGYIPQTQTIYIFGGMGNESGEQVVGRTYFYDLHRVDLATGEVAKLWEIPWNKSNVVPVRGMVIPDGDCFYTLCYPEHFSDSYLRLYRFSLADGNYVILGDSIPIHSDRITTNANIYYDEQLNTLFALVQEFDDDIVSDLKIYSLAFPPITADELSGYADARRDNRALMAVLVTFICVAISGAALFRKFGRRAGQGAQPDLLKRGGEGETAVRPNSVYLFGDFTIYGRDGRDVSYMFSARLRETFCLILQYSAGDGVTSQRLSNLLWPDKPQDKVKNSRGVTINHLRKALSELDGIELIYDKGCFKVVHGDGVYCDYTRCLQIVASKNSDEAREELLRIISRGKFLKFLEQPLFDSFKEGLERKLEPVLRVEMERSLISEDYRSALRFAEAMFNIDPLSDEALAVQTRALNKLKLNAEAWIRYQAFAAEYKNTMGCEYPQSFKNL